MSIPAFAWAMERGRALKLLPSERLVLIYLADMANGARVCWPGQETIVQFTGLALRTVRSAVDRLVGRGLIRVEDSPGRVMRYHILRDDTPANDDGVGKPNGQVVHNPGKSSQGKRSQPRQNVPTHPGNSCIEPRDISTETPAKCLTDPYLPKKETLERGACAPEAKAQNLDSGGKERQQASQQAAPEAADPDARVSEEAFAAVRRAIAGEPEAEPVPDAQRMEARNIVGGLTRHLGQREYAPGRRPVRSVHEQIAAAEDAPLDAPLPPIHPAVADHVWAARRALAEHAARLGRVAA
jgi:hypothetical protein